MSKFENIGIVGAGAWGTALAQSACLAGRNVTIWANESATVTSINSAHENTAFLPGIELDPRLRATDDLSEMDNVDVILMVTPAFVLMVSTQGIAAAGRSPVPAM